MIDPPVTPSFKRLVPTGDSRERAVCARCGFIAYENPKIVVASVVRHEGRILLCRRAIEPRSGFWTLPAGFLELHETPEDGAKREAVEEAEARITLRELLAVYSVPRLSQVQLMYRAVLAEPHIAPGPESAQVGLFAWSEIPWDQLAFPSVHWALHHDRAVERGEAVPPFVNPSGETGDLAR
jgi:ADP-ribose pyrophosphatase YjhB (NUDIX family)